MSADPGCVGYWGSWMSVASGAVGGTWEVVRVGEAAIPSY
jgi:hypothetical protein